MSRETVMLIVTITAWPGLSRSTSARGFSFRAVTIHAGHIVTWKQVPRPFCLLQCRYGINLDARIGEDSLQFLHLSWITYSNREKEKKRRERYKEKEKKSMQRFFLKWTKFFNLKNRIDSINMNNGNHVSAWSGVVGWFVRWIRSAAK